jgi:hypothetical protein
MIDFSPILSQFWRVFPLFIIPALFKQLKSAKQDLTSRALEWNHG